MVAGAEWIGYAPLGNQPPSVIQEPEEDCLFYQGEASFVLLEQGMFALLFPDDLHMPCVRAGHERVKKVVVKIRV
jgi:YhcH/YjgK/YiaL family protein